MSAACVGAGEGRVQAQATAGCRRGLSKGSFWGWGGGCKEDEERDGDSVHLELQPGPGTGPLPGTCPCSLGEAARSQLRESQAADQET